MKYFFASFLSFVLFSGSLYSFSLETVVSNAGTQQLDLLKKEGVLRSSSDKTDDLLYLPPVEPFLSIQRELAPKQNKTNLEALYYLPDLSLPPALKFQNLLLKVSSLTGLPFYSRSEKKIKTLIYELYAVNEKTLEKVPDPSVNKITPKISFPVFQNDETFGKSYYRLTMSYHPTSIFSMHIQNTQPLKKGIFTTAKEGESELFVSVIPLDKKGLLIYTLSSTRQSPPAFVKKSANDSLFNRMDAYKDWIVARCKTAGR